jgi:hypothetical protein
MDPDTLCSLSEGAINTSRQYFSESVVRQQLAEALAGLRI